jgi:type II secretory pathway pseudopilin PulG
MKPIHALAIAAVLAVASVVGVTAATKTATLGASARQASAASLATRAHKLDSFEAALKRALRRKPPALPKVSAVHGAAGAAPGGSPLLGTASAPRVIYRRPAPIIIHKQRRQGDDGYESASGESSGGDD